METLKLDPPEVTAKGFDPLEAADLAVSRSSPVICLARFAAACFPLFQIGFAAATATATAVGFVGYSAGRIVAVCLVATGPPDLIGRSSCPASFVAVVVAEAVAVFGAAFSSGFQSSF